MHWLKEIEESMHGTVDYTTMKQVDAINCSGIYYVGKPKMIEDAIGENIGITVDDSLYLVLPEDKVNNREKKIYSLEEVKDVQSKLMLIAGKAANVKEEVEHFVEVCIITCFISIPHWIPSLFPVAMLSIATGHAMQIFNCLGQLRQL